MKRFASIISLAAILVIAAASMASAEQPDGPWGDEPWESWCEAQYPNFPPECTAQWHPVEHEAEVAPAPEPVHEAAPIEMSTVHYVRHAPLAATGSPIATLSALSLIAFGFIGLGAGARRAARRRSLARLLAPYGVR